MDEMKMIKDSLCHDDNSEASDSQPGYKQNTKSLQCDQDLELLKLSFKRTEPRGNILLFEEMFQSNKHHEKLSENNEKDLRQKLETSERGKLLAEKKLSDLEKTVSLLEQSIQSLHNDLDLCDKLAQENRELKNVNIKLENDLLAQNELQEEQKRSFEHLLQIEQSKSQKQKEDLEKEMQENLCKQEQKFKEQLEVKYSEFENLKKEKKSEMQKITVEYESKLAKLQRQKATATQNQLQSSSANQEIFRKKLQHLKREHEIEINGLKEQIKTLQAQTAASRPTSVQQGGSQQTPVSAMPLFKRMRRY